MSDDETGVEKLRRIAEWTGYQNESLFDELSVNAVLLLFEITTNPDLNDFDVIEDVPNYQTVLEDLRKGNIKDISDYKMLK